MHVPKGWIYGSSHTLCHNSLHSHFPQKRLTLHCLLLHYAFVCAWRMGMIIEGRECENDDQHIINEKRENLIINVISTVCNPHDYMFIMGFCISFGSDLISFREMRMAGIQRAPVWFSSLFLNYCRRYWWEEQSILSRSKETQMDLSALYCQEFLILKFNILPVYICCKLSYKLIKKSVACNIEVSKFDVVW